MRSALRLIGSILFVALWMALIVRFGAFLGKLGNGRTVCGRFPSGTVDAPLGEQKGPMSVGRICIRDVDTVSADETVLIAARRMRDRQVGTLIVVNDRRQPMGLLSDRDLAMRVVAQERDPARTPVAEVMTAMPMTVLETSSIESALGHMRTGRFRRLPVVNGVGEFVGIVTLDDILTLLAEEFSMIGTLLERESQYRAA